MGLVIPTGYSFNLDGTSIYLTMAAVFIAQATERAADAWAQQLGILGVLLLTSKGAAGVTGGGFITLAATLSTTGNVPVAGLALLLGVDRFMSEARAITNLIGNGVATMVVARWEGRSTWSACSRCSGRPRTLRRRSRKRSTTVGSRDRARCRSPSSRNRRDRRSRDRSAAILAPASLQVGSHHLGPYRASASILQAIRVPFFSYSALADRPRRVSSSLTTWPPFITKPTVSSARTSCERVGGDGDQVGVAGRGRACRRPWSGRAARRRRRSPSGWPGRASGHT